MLDISYKEILGIITIAIVVPQVYFYIKSILMGETKPHIYTKIIWFILTGIGFIISLQQGGGPGSWIMGVTALVQLITLLLSLKYGTSDITRFDTALLILALLCIPIYLGFDDKIYALIFVLFIDFLGYIPTYRKTYNDPYSESLLVWNIATTKYVIAVFAIIEYSFYTVAYPVFILIANCVLIGIMLAGRTKEKIKIPS